MKKLIDLIQEELVKAFTAAEMDPSYARVSVSNRPDLCEYQCNGAMAAAKAYHKAPIQLAEAFCRESKKSENHHRRLRRSKRGKTASRRPSPFRDHRGKH